MLEPRQNWIVFKFFSWYINRIIKSDFQDLKFNKISIDSGRSILLLANHFSWWDGFVLFQINRLYFRKKFHVMITEENYQKVWFLKYLGSFSVKKNSRFFQILKRGHDLFIIFVQLLCPGISFFNHFACIDNHVFYPVSRRR